MRSKKGQQETMYKHVKRVTEWGPRPLRSAQFRKRENGGEQWTPDDKLPGRRGRPPRPSRPRLLQDAGSRCKLQGVQSWANCAAVPLVRYRSTCLKCWIVQRLFFWQIEEIDDSLPSSWFYEPQDRLAMRCCPGTPRSCPRRPLVRLSIDSLTRSGLDAK